MKLGVNGWRLRTRTGVARVLINIVKHWTQDFVAGRFDEITIYSPKPLPPDLPLPSFLKTRVVWPDARMLAWENLCFARAAREDVVLCPSYSRPLFARGKTVAILYEATQKLFPRHYSVAARFIHTPLYGWSARNSTLVITNTDEARQDIAEAYGAPLDKIRVVPLAPAEIFRPCSNSKGERAIKERYLGAVGPFFLYVGKLTSRRNVPVIVSAFAKLKRASGLPHRLLIVGLNTTNIDLADLARKEGVAGMVKHHSYVEDADLARLYAAAEAFILPYTYESAFALTLIEAQAAGAPVITTDTPGLRRAAGNAALFTKDVEVDTLAEAMHKVSSEPVFREDLVRRGRANAETYSWARTSNVVLDILREAVRI